MKTVHWGILGTAKIAQTQLIPAIKRSRNTEVVAIASRSEKVHEIAEKLEIPKAYESYEALLNDPEIDVIYIPLPNHLHKEWITRAAQAGKHVLSEKPVTLTADEAKEVVAVCKEIMSYSWKHSCINFTRNIRGFVIF
ncbi:Gfo/Idh/MocA family oxidoreductase [Caldifermentibacillus hisashii]|uniref:Gfo/Idh/MocA family protein n=1 Tax=Caldifermentibacillus hisashii TaxID=996558 RepID=UPI0031351AE1